MTTITATAGGDAAEIQLTIKPTADVLTVYRTDANGTHPVRTRAGVLPYPLTGTEKRRNFCSNPTFTFDVSGWLPVGTATLIRLASGGSQGSSAGRTTFPTAALTGNVGTYGDFSCAVVTGDWVSLSAYVRPSAALSLFLKIELRSATAAITAASGTPVSCPAGVWTRLSVSVKATGAATLVRCQNYLNTAVSTAGMTLDLDGILVEKTATIGSYFDGTTKATATTGFKWTGIPDASASVEIDGSLLVLDDYEPAAGIVNYVVRDSQGATATEASVSASFDMGSPWLSVPTMQTLSRPVESVLTYDATRDTRSTIIDIPGRPDPIVVLRAMGTRRGSVEIFTGTHAEAAAIISLCDRGEVLMLRQPDHMGMDMYFTALSADIRVLQASAQRTVFSVVLRYVETRFPAGSLLNEPGWDFTGLAAENTSFNALSTRYQDFQAAALHKPLGGA